MRNGSERPTHPTGRSADHVKLAVTSVPIAFPKKGRLPADQLNIFIPHRHSTQLRIQAQQGDISAQIRSVRNTIFTPPVGITILESAMLYIFWYMESTIEV